MRSNKYIIYFFALVALIVAPVSLTSYKGTLKIEPAKVQAAVICKQGGSFTSFPSTCPFGFTNASESESAAYTNNPANAADLARTKKAETDPYGTANNACSGLTGCLAWVMYWIGPGFASWVASIAAFFFNYIVKISLNSTAYALGFLTTSWSLVLNLANMFFIFILIYTAFVIMLKAETTRTMQTLAWVIAIALVVNFSFFFTRVVIDAGNILGVQFYNGIIAQPNIAGVTITNEPNAPVDITRGIMQALGVEKPLTQQGFTNAQAVTGNNAWSTLLVLTVVFLSTAVMFWMLALGLIMIAIKFLIRIVGLWLVLIASPIAFVSKTLPKTQHFFEMWLRTLVSFAFYPAIFLFMFYVLNMFVADLAGNKLFAALSSKQGMATDLNPLPLIAQLAEIFIRMGFLIVMMYIMLKVADWIMDQAGGMAGTIMNKASGAILGGGFRGAGVALRATSATGAFAGRNVGGRGAFATLQNSTIKSWEGQSGLRGTLWRGLTGVSKGTWDIRNAPGGSILKKATSKIVGDVNVGTASKRNFAKTVADKAKRDEERGKTLKASEGEIWNAQQDFQNRYDTRNGPGSYTTRINDLQTRMRMAREEAVRQHARAALDPAGAAGFKALARTNENEERRLAGELKNHTEQGKKIAEDFAKTRIMQFADRLDKRNVEGNMFNPSWGHVEGAARLRKLVEGKTSTQKIKDAVKEATEEDGDDHPPAGGGGAGGGGHGPTAPAGGAHGAGGGGSAFTKAAGTEHALADAIREASEKTHKDFKNLEKSLHEAAGSNGPAHVPTTEPTLNVKKMSQNIADRLGEHLQPGNTPPTTPKPPEKPEEKK